MSLQKQEHQGCLSTVSEVKEDDSFCSGGVQVAGSAEPSLAPAERDVPLLSASHNAESMLIAASAEPFLPVSPLFSKSKLLMSFLHMILPLHLLPACLELSQTCSPRPSFGF